MLHPRSQAVVASSPVAESARIDRPINSGWKFLRGEAPDAEAIVFDDSKWASVDLPHNLNIRASVDEGKPYAGPAWYRSHINVGADLAGKQLFLRFGAASRVADVCVNGRTAGTHKGAFAAFCLNITTLAHPGDNVVAVRLDNTFNRGVSPLSGDFTTHGGLYRGAQLLALNPISISPLDDAGPGVYLKTEVTEASADVEVTTKLRNSTDENVEVTVECTIADATGQTIHHSVVRQTILGQSISDAVDQFTITRPHLWNGREDPYLYQATVKVRLGDSVIDRVVQPFGLRYFRVDPDSGLHLNGEPYDFHGVNYHQGRPSVGFADTPEMREEDHKLMVDMGCTGVRMAHYQHNDDEYTLCDRSGLIVWAELALINKMADTSEFRENVKQQLRELIKQGYNHPSVFFWSMYNEPWLGVEAGTQEQWSFIDELVALAHELDPTRLTTGATVRGVDGPINWYMDVTAMNRYDGWYDRAPGDWTETLSGLRSQYPGKCLGIGEYGAGASAFQHENRPSHPVADSRWHPEEWQEIVHEHAYAAMRDRRWLWCKLVWCMFDFESSGRNEGDQPGINDKGLVTGDRKTCKDAYFFYKACWSREPFVYITERRFSPRPSGEADLKVYSNCDVLELRIDGRSLGIKSAPDHIFVWPNVMLADGAVRVEAAGSVNGRPYSDRVEWAITSAGESSPKR